MKTSLQYYVLCAPVFILRSGSSALLECPPCHLSIWLALLAISNTLFYAYAKKISRENIQKTKIFKVHHFRLTQKWLPTVTTRRCAKLLYWESLFGRKLKAPLCKQWLEQFCTMYTPLQTWFPQTYVSSDTCRLVLRRLQPLNKTSPYHLGKHNTVGGPSDSHQQTVPPGGRSVSHISHSGHLHDPLDTPRHHFAHEYPWLMKTDRR